MIHSVKITNFRSFSHLEIDHLSRITLIGGYNNIGKTNFLEAIFMVQDRKNPEIINRLYKSRGIGEIFLLPEALWGPLFYNYNMTKSAQVNINNKELFTIDYIEDYNAITNFDSNQEKKIIESTKPSGALKIQYFYNNDPELEIYLMPSTEGTKIQSNKQSSFKKTPTPTIFLHASIPVNPNENATRLGQLMINYKEETIVKFLQVIEPRLKSLSLIPLVNTAMIHGDIGDTRRVPVNLFGEGFMRLLSIILAIATTNNGLILIDEIENGIHHSVMSKVWEAIGKAALEYNCQIIATTHSYECIQSAHKALFDMPDLLTFIRLERMKEEQILAKTFDYQKLGISLEHEWEVR